MSKKLPASIKKLVYAINGVQISSWNNIPEIRVSHRFSDTINSRTRLRSPCNTEAVIFSVQMYYLVTDIRKISAQEKTSRRN